MPLPLIPIAMTLAQFAPGIARWLGGDRAGDIAQKAVSVANTITGHPDPEAAAAAIAGDPALQIEYQRAMAPIVIAELESEARKLESVNETMRAEMSSGDKYVRRWRPTWGYVTAIAWVMQSLAVAGAVAGAVFATQSGESEAARALLTGAADLLAALTAQWGIALTVLGVNVTSRSRDKQVAAGQSPPPSLFGRVVDAVLPPRRPEARQ